MTVWPHASHMLPCEDVTGVSACMRVSRFLRSARLALPALSQCGEHCRQPVGCQAVVEQFEVVRFGSPTIEDSAVRSPVRILVHRNQAEVFQRGVCVQTARARTYSSSRCRSLIWSLFGAELWSMRKSIETSVRHNLKTEV